MSRVLPLSRQEFIVNTVNSNDLRRERPTGFYQCVECCHNAKIDELLRRQLNDFVTRIVVEPCGLCVKHDERANFFKINFTIHSNVHEYKVMTVYSAELAKAMHSCYYGRTL